MDHRTILPAGTELAFPGMTCVVGHCIGRGSNAIVYEATYQDATSSRQKHHVLVKELFPFDPRGLVRREADLSVCRDPEGEDLWQMHLESFQRGNDIHLQLLALYPDQLGSNINTFPLNNTLYTILDDPGSRSLEKELGKEPAPNLRKAANWCLQLLDCLEVFHRQQFLHLDISLDNVLLTGEGERERVMLTDYNSVYSRAEIQRGGETVCFSAKEGFTAPETQTGMYGDISYCTDLFSVAAVFYATLTGSPPSMIQLSRKNPPDARESPLLIDASQAVREQVRKILRRGLCTLPDKRYQSCAYMKQDLAELIARMDRQETAPSPVREAEPEAARPQAPEESAAQAPEKEKPAASKKRTVAAAVAAGILLCAACAWLFWIRPTAPDRVKNTELPAETPTVSAGELPAETPSSSVEELLLFTETDKLDDPNYESLIQSRRMAANGDTWQLFGLGMMYEDGAAVEQDYGIARQYYLHAAEKNEPGAYLRLGIFYEQGFGVEKSMDTALRYYQKAADLGLADGFILLGNVYADEISDYYNRDEAIRNYQKAADLGNPEAYVQLGNVYASEAGGLQDLKEAGRCYRTAVSMSLEDAWGEYKPGESQGQT